MRAAQIALNTKGVHAIDKFFTYLVPEGMELTQGMRVTVPFGNANRLTEGFVVQMISPESPSELKTVHSVIDREVMCDSNAMELAFWIRNRYFCTYFEALRLMLPPGSGLKYQETVTLTQHDPVILEQNTSRSAVQRDAVRFLLENEGISTMTEMNHHLGKNVRPAIRALIKKNLVEISRKRVLPVREKVRIVASLAAESELISAYLNEYGTRAVAAARILEILEAEGELDVPQLLDSADAGRSSLNLLVEKGFVALETHTVDRNEPQMTEREFPKQLTVEQEHVLSQIGQDGEYLICGVTGSGKTEVYLQLIQRVIDQGKQAIVMVPEISLTPQTIQRFTARFGEVVAVLHSGLSLGERFDSWEKIRRGEAQVVVGARSAVFAPVKRLGAIIIDEQNEETYCSEQAPRYDAREVALFRAKQNGALLIQASATPRVQDVYRLRGRVLYMSRRYNSHALPRVFVEDMREELKNGNATIFSQRLSEEIQKNLDSGKQTILFVSRRGHSTFVSCRNCGYVFECPNCSVSLKYHSHSGRLMCHYCGYMQPLSGTCPQCGSSYVKLFGLGTQRAEEEIVKHFPRARVLRMDQDTTVKKFSYRKILDTFSKGEADILLGTQMVTKGLDFPNVTLVGVLAADLMLNGGNYSAYEETFSRLTQVFGRAGRGEEAGRAVVQTYQPEQFCIQMAANQDYPSFYKSEIGMRKTLYYPPFVSLVTLVLTGLSDYAVKKEAYYLYHTLTDGGLPPGVRMVLNPVPCGVARINRYYRWQIVLKCEEEVNGLLWQIYDRHNRHQQKTKTYLSIHR